jgi:competence protein ComEA
MKTAKIREHLKLHHGETTLIVFALLIIIVGGVAILFQLHPWAKGSLEITMPDKTSPLAQQTEIYIDGDIASPGWFAISEDTRISDLIDMAGGSGYKAGISTMKLYIPDDDSYEPQKISINHADAWLLDALPGIGPTTAQKIIDYREANGPFVTISEIKLVPGISDSTYENIKDLITVE